MPLLQTFLSPIWDIWAALRVSLPPFVHAVCSRPSLLLHPFQMRRLFFAFVWDAFSEPTDTAGAPVKARLLTDSKRARGRVLEIGAGHGHSLKYLDPDKVEVYIAVEPNRDMHDKILNMGVAHGWRQDQIMVLPLTVEEVLALCEENQPPLQTQSIDCIISILTFCSFPPSTLSRMPAFFDTVLAPKGSFLFYEHVLSPIASSRIFQRIWTPIWSTLFDGCKLDRDSVKLIKEVGCWNEGETVLFGKDGEDRESLWWHQAGIFVKG
ncbi:hypothetical protein BT69DRAFT_1336869 [Atractiella rhizophila]|nr:hypothetical protein BT69DRAFT_1336869 [Atractiella rhizophila]